MIASPIRFHWTKWTSYTPLYPTLLPTTVAFTIAIP